MAQEQSEVSSNEQLSEGVVLAIIGFSLYSAWILLSSFWLLKINIVSIGVVISPFETFCVFLAFSVGYACMSLFAKYPSFTPFELRGIIGAGILAMVLPVVDLVSVFSGQSFVLLNCVAFFLTGLAGSYIQTCWLDVFSRSNINNLAIYFGSSVVFGVILLLLITSMPTVAQAIASACCVLVSLGLMSYTSKTIAGNKLRAPLESTPDRWQFTKEIEPSLVMFGIIFGLSLFYMDKADSAHLLIGLCGMGIGAACVAIIGLLDASVNVTVIQRITVVILVIVCIAMPFGDWMVRLALTSVVAALCAFLIIANSIFLIRKICNPRTVPVFRAIPKRLALLSSGFAFGWLIPCITLSIPGVDSSVIGVIRIVLAIILVAIVMAFLPIEQHHVAEERHSSKTTGKTTAKADAGAAATSQGAPAEASQDAVHAAPPVTPPGVVRTESEIFEMRCAAIVKLYQLSPREADILPYLAKGRNNAYLQEKFVISPHTAKSHIYNIYRKLDIHSQQKLMDFVEEFPLDGVK